nr:pentatricopeptide repeat-containing protein At1g03560, mitochondrial-like [Ipomoea trifida]
MRKTLTKPLRTISAIVKYSNGKSKFPAFLTAHFSKPYPDSHFASIPKWVFTATKLPPPEWVQPFTDLSDIITDHKNLQPSPWVSQILSLLDNSPTMEENLKTYCKKFLIKLSPNFVAFVLKSGQLSENSHTAYRFFTWAGKQRGYAHNFECYVSLIAILSACNDVNRLRDIFRELKDRDFMMNLVGANSLVRSLGSVGMVEELLWVWRCMKESGIQPTLYTYNFLLNGLVNSMFIESAEQVFEVMESGKTPPDIVSYNTMIKGYCKIGKIQKAMEKFRDMEVRNVGPDKITYMTLIQACYSEGDFDSCLGLYHEMVENELDVPLHAYSLVIGRLSRDDALVKSRKSDEAMMLFNRMEQEGCDQTVYTYTILISGLFKDHRNEDALKLWNMMIDKGITPTAASFRALSTGLCLSGKVARACKILDELAPMGIVLETAFEDMINVLCKAGRIVEACKLADGIVDRGREIPGRVRTVLINALRKAGNADLAIKLMHSKIGIGYDRMGSIKKRVKFRTLVDK